MVVNEPNKKGKKTQTHTNSNKGTHHAQKSNIEGRNGGKKSIDKIAHAPKNQPREREKCEYHNTRNHFNVDVN